ncbi:putative manganese-dependent inorganic diphosphatase [Roseimicrobium sp. ORNL1]|uniref:putative manganese-dependent inorganic diphosphatase n=1 Tax=Roseimicrobium sp. ORNL1 TaxID=2711231 RepID=UPI0013E19B10|nr:putative manganese-dependent inorganic diphosphatase [Roseimicrobium sp. ORNL1]QIF05897.1 putative manganese-dependent inorganic diphosphatase [Roseimicrobium sp. ORNL1]
MSTAESDPIYVIGHRNPDADAICSAIGYTAFLRASRGSDARAACCGEMNTRTSWVLDYAKVDAPKLLMDVRPTAATVCRKNVVTARREDTCLSVHRKMLAYGFRSLPVVDEEGCIVGMPSLQELAQLFLPSEASDEDANRYVRTSEANIVAALDGTFPNGREARQEVETRVLMVAGSSMGTTQTRMKRFPHSSVMVLVGDRPDVQEMAIRNGVDCLIITGGFQVDDAIMALARQEDVPVICTRYDTASAAQLVRFSRPIADALHDDFQRFAAKTPLKEILVQTHDSHQPLFPVVDDDSGKLMGVFSKSDLVDVPRAKIVLVDHNEFAQAVTGADEAEILEVIDHHRLSGNLRTKEPVRFINEPVGSTSTIVAMMYRLRNLEPDRATAICLCAGLISDTLNLTSPTTTSTDSEILPWLAGIAGIDVAKFTAEFFSAGSMLRDKPAGAALESDRKEFEENGWKLSISQIEELGLDEFWKQEGALRDALENVVRQRGVHFACLLVTDITRHDSILLTAGSDRVSDAIEYPELKPKVFELKGVVSRKKQLFPYLSRVVAKLVAPV